MGQVRLGREGEGGRRVDWVFHNFKWKAKIFGRFD